MEVHDNSIWFHLFESMPPFLRWTLYILSCGILALVSIVWRHNHRRVTKLERSSDTHVTQSQFRLMDQRVGQLQDHFDGRLNTIQTEISDLTGHVIEAIKHRNGEPK